MLLVPKVHAPFIDSAKISSNESFNLNSQIELCSLLHQPIQVKAHASIVQIDKELMCDSLLSFSSFSRSRLIYVGDGTSGTSADAPGLWSWTGVGLILIGKNMEIKAIGLENWKKMAYFCYNHWLFGAIRT